MALLGTALTRKQQDRLDRLAEDHPSARVAGWDSELRGPIVAIGSTSVVATREGGLRTV